MKVLKQSVNDIWPNRLSLPLTKYFRLFSSCRDLNMPHSGCRQLLGRKRRNGKIRQRYYKLLFSLFDLNLKLLCREISRNHKSQKALAVTRC